MESGDFSGYDDAKNRVNEDYASYYNVPQVQRESALYDLATQPVKVGEHYYTVSRGTGVMNGRISQVMNERGKYIRTESTMQKVEKAIIQAFKEKLKELRG